jgi:hypothetical protein
MKEEKSRCEDEEPNIQRVKELLKYIKATGQFHSTLMNNTQTSEHAA